MTYDRRRESVVQPGHLAFQTLTYPLDKAETNELWSVDAVLQVAQEHLIVKPEDFLHVAEEEVALAIQVHRDEGLHLGVQHFILVTLSRKNHQCQLFSTARTNSLFLSTSL